MISSKYSVYHLKMLSVILGNQNVLGGNRFGNYDRQKSME